MRSDLGVGGLKSILEIEKHNQPDKAIVFIAYDFKH